MHFWDHLHNGSIGQVPFSFLGRFRCLNQILAAGKDVQATWPKSCTFPHSQEPFGCTFPQVGLPLLQEVSGFSPTFTWALHADSLTHGFKKIYVHSSYVCQPVHPLQPQTERIKTSTIAGMVLKGIIFRFLTFRVTKGYSIPSPIPMFLCLCSVFRIFFLHETKPPLCPKTDVPRRPCTASLVELVVAWAPSSSVLFLGEFIVLTPN